MNEPKVKLSEGQNTREDALLIAHALWEEARARGWEQEYKEILANAGLSAQMPVVGQITSMMAYVGRPEAMGEVGDYVKNFMVPNGAATVSFAYVAETEGEPGVFDCICPAEEAIQTAALKHLRDKGTLGGRISIAHWGTDKGEASCSSPNCNY